MLPDSDVSAGAAVGSNKPTRILPGTDGIPIQRGLAGSGNQFSEIKDWPSPAESGSLISREIVLPHHWLRTGRSCCKDRGDRRRSDEAGIRAGNSGVQHTAASAEVGAVASL